MAATRRIVGHLLRLEAQLEYRAAGRVPTLDAVGARSRRQARAGHDLEGRLEDRLAVFDPAPDQETRLHRAGKVGVHDIGLRLPPGEHAFIGVVADPLIVAVPHDVGVARWLDRLRSYIEAVYARRPARIGVVGVRPARPAAGCVIASPVVSPLVRRDPVGTAL